MVVHILVVSLFILEESSRPYHKKKISNGIREDVRLLKCDDEEADDRIMYHISHAVTVQNCEKIVVAS